MDMRQLEAFVWVVRLGSFSKAGERLYLTQPTISAHVGALERELGVRLVARTTKAVSPTDAGSRLLVYAEEILRLRDEAVSTVTALRKSAGSLCALFRIDPAARNVVSFVGSGGKTTFLFALANELAQLGRRVAVTTTTHIYRPDMQQCAHVVTDGDLGKIDAFLTASRLVTVGAPAENGKLGAPAAEVLEYLRRTADAVLIEADGSRGLPMKATAAHEPVLWQKTQRVIAVAGLSALGEPIGAVCHRAQLAQELLGVPPEHPVGPDDMARLVAHCYGRYGERLTVALNQADNAFLRAKARETAQLLRENGVGRVVITSFLSRQFEAYGALAESGAQ